MTIQACYGSANKKFIASLADFGHERDRFRGGVRGGGGRAKRIH